MTNYSFAARDRLRRMLALVVLTGFLAGSGFARSDAQAAPSDTTSEKAATTADSTARKWSGIDLSRYGDAIRKTSRITYPDAGRVPQVSCNVIGDLRTDMVFLDQKNRQIHILDYIPYGSDEDDIERSISEQPGAIHVNLPEGAGDWQLSCVKRNRGEAPALAVANGNKVFISASGQLEDGQVFPTAATYTFDGQVSSIAPLTPGVDTPGMLVAANSKAYLFDSVSDGDNGTNKATKTWEIGEGRAQITPLGYALNEETTIGVGKPEQNLVYVISANAESGNASDVGITIKANGGTFGASLVAIGDLNDDDSNEYAIGAPEANNNTGAVSIIFGSQETTGTINVDVTSTSQTPVTRDGQAAGTLIRQANRGHIGTSLAYITGEGMDNPGALVISRPGDEEHPGAVIVSEKALSQNWNTGQGLGSIPNSQAAVLASEEGSGDGGYYVGTVPADNSDNDLVGIYTVDTKGKVDVWTVDMRLQTQTTPPAQPKYPQPPAPSAAPAYQPIDESDQKSWLGEFTSGFGGVLAKGSCDVTGDGKPDLVAGSAVRSEYKFDPLYEDSTTTHGWVFNVTGQIQVVPGGTPGGLTTNNNNKVISILGPIKTHDPAVDAAFGFSVACLGDVNGDGVDDIAASSVSMGRVWVIYGGKALAQTNLNELDPSRGYIVDMPYEQGAAGFQVTRVGDVDNDGHADLGFVVANVPLAMGDTRQTYGAAFVVKGNASGQTINLQNLNGANPDVIWRVNSPKGHTLNAFTPVGDVNGDGVVDYVLADFNSFTTNYTVPGTAWVVYGNREHRSVDLQDSIPASGYELAMSEALSYRLGAGNSIAPAGDVNNDGIGDFVIGFDGGTLMNQTEGGVALVLGTKESVSKRNIDPANVGKTDSNIRLITGASKESGFGWATDAIPVSGKNPAGLLAIGAGGQGENGTAYVLRLTDIPAGITPIASLGDKITVLDSTGERSRFGRSVAFIGDYLGQPTLAVGGDGVIDNAATGEQGYAHSAHILAIATQKLGFKVATETSDTPGTGNPGETGNPGKSDNGEQITDNGRPVSWSPGVSFNSGSNKVQNNSHKDKKDENKKPADAKISAFDKQFKTPVKLAAGAITRAAGANRVETSLNALKFAKNHETVVLATGSNFPDALVGGALAGAMKAGVVLTTGATLEPEILNQLKAQGTRTVTIVGGFGAISAEKEAQLKAAGFTVNRLAGSDRYETAKLVKNATRNALGLQDGVKSKLSCNATGSNFPDALACAAVASLTGGVVDLVRPGAQVTADAGSEKTICAGGPACTAVGIGVNKIIGSDRYETAYKIAEMAPASDNVIVTNASQVAADSLVASALSASTGARLVLSNGKRVNVPAGTKRMQLIGGQSALPEGLSVFTK